VSAGAEAHEPLLQVADGRQQQGLVAAEAKRLAGPIMASCVLQSVVDMVSVMVVGHLGELLLACASLANVTGYSLLVRNDTLSYRPPQNHYPLSPIY
jgi:multidrug resistance protein, MATE family